MIVMMKFNFMRGSYDSLEFLKALIEKAAELNQLFSSNTVKHLLMFKFSNVYYLGFALFLIYLVYLAFATFYPIKSVMTCWLVFYTIQKAIIMKGLWNGSWSKYFNDVITFWNVLDIVRIASLLGYVICD
jgi:hypothetical protein